MRSFLNTFDLTHGLLGAIGMGIIVFLINMHTGMGLEAGIAQATISFLIVGVNTGVFKKLCEKKKLQAILIPTLFTTFVATIVHFVTGTPEMFLTILSVFGLGAFHFLVLTLIYIRFGTVDPKRLFL